MGIKEKIKKLFDNLDKKMEEKSKCNCNGKCKK